MADPQTPNIGAYQPTRGSDPGTWDSPVNANTGVQDSLAANVAAISLSNAPVTLTTPPNSGASWAGPYQSQSAVLRFTGVLTANVTVTLPRAGFWIVENLTSGAFVVFLASSAPGNIICSPPGEMTQIFCDGVNVKYCNLDRVGEYLFLGASAIPAWISNCTVAPYLNCNGTTFNATTYPVLNGLLGGNTLPDLRGRVFGALNQGTGRFSAGGVNGDNFLAAGGADTVTIAKANIPSYNLSVTDPGHTHTVTAAIGAGGVSGGSGSQNTSNSVLTTSSASTGITVGSGGSGTALGIPPPVAIGGLILIRAG